MKTLNPYLNFAGNCQQALSFYESALNGKVVMRQTFGQAPQAAKGFNPSHIMHAEFKAHGVFFMACDHPAATEQPSNSINIALNINFTDLDEQQDCFEKLSENGKILMPLADTFWGSRFGKLQDQFGIQWLLNCPNKK